MLEIPFEKLTKGMTILVKKPGKKALYLSRVVDTSLGHPSVPKLRLGSGHSVTYGVGWQLFEDSKINRTEILLEQANIEVDDTLK
jgi:hypothetical protein